MLGYTNIKVFDAGYPAWKKAFGTAPAVAVKAGEEEGSIDPGAFEKILAENPQSIYLVDVRDPDEFAAGHFKTAVNIPVDNLEDKLNTLPSDKPIVFVCATGARSGESFYMLQDLKPDLKKVYYLDAEVQYKKDGPHQIKANK
jgi:rhodanese-related sulfurtransferase